MLQRQNTTLDVGRLPSLRGTDVEKRIHGSKAPQRLRILQHITGNRHGFDPPTPLLDALKRRHISPYGNHPSPIASATNNAAPPNPPVAGLTMTVSPAFTSVSLNPPHDTINLKMTARSPIPYPISSHKSPLIQHLARLQRHLNVFRIHAIPPLSSHQRLTPLGEHLVDPALSRRTRVVPPADRAVHQDNKHPGLQQRGVRSYGRDAPDGAGAGDERRGDGVLALSGVDFARVGYRVRGEDADDGAAGAGFWRRDCLDGWGGGVGGYDEGAVGFWEGLVGYCLLGLVFGGLEGWFSAWG